jgi:hypothetical protein
MMGWLPKTDRVSSRYDFGLPEVRQLIDAAPKAIDAASG